MNWTFYYMAFMAVLYLSFNATIIAMLQKDKDGEFMQSMYGDRFYRSSIAMLSISSIFLVYLIIVRLVNPKNLEFSDKCYSKEELHSFIIAINAVTLGITSDMIYQMSKGPGFNKLSQDKVIKGLFWTMFSLSLVSVLGLLIYKLMNKSKPAAAPLPQGYSSGYTPNLYTSQELPAMDYNALMQQQQAFGAQPAPQYFDPAMFNTAYDPYAYTLN